MSYDLRQSFLVALAVFAWDTLYMKLSPEMAGYRAAIAFVACILGGYGWDIVRPMLGASLSSLSKYGRPLMIGAIFLLLVKYLKRQVQTDAMELAEGALASVAASYVS